LVSDAQEVELHEPLKSEFATELNRLNEAATVGTEVFKALAKKSSDLTKFQMSRDQIVDRQNSLQTIVQSIQQQGLRPMEEARNDLQRLDVSLFEFI
jgi:hypothetical protein